MTRHNGRGHTAWCARGHHCNLGEHRSPELLIDIAGGARAVLVRVRTDTGREHAEMRLAIALSPVEAIARRQLAGLLGDLRHVLARAAIARPRR